jgi:hypothetical protein
MGFVRAASPEAPPNDGGGEGPHAGLAAVQVFAPKRQTDGAAAAAPPRSTALVDRLLQRAEERKQKRGAAGCAPHLHQPRAAPSHACSHALCRWLHGR